MLLKAMMIDEMGSPQNLQQENFYDNKSVEEQIADAERVTQIQHITQNRYRSPQQRNFRDSSKQLFSPGFSSPLCVENNHGRNVTKRPNTNAKKPQFSLMNNFVRTQNDQQQFDASDYGTNTPVKHQQIQLTSLSTRKSINMRTKQQTMSKSKNIFPQLRQPVPKKQVTVYSPSRGARQRKFITKTEAKRNSFVNGASSFVMFSPDRQKTSELSRFGQPPYQQSQFKNQIEPLEPDYLTNFHVNQQLFFSTEPHMSFDLDNKDTSLRHQLYKNTISSSASENERREIMQQACWSKKQSVMNTEQDQQSYRSPLPTKSGKFDEESGIKAARFMTEDVIQEKYQSSTEKSQEGSIHNIRMKPLQQARTDKKDIPRNRLKNRFKGSLNSIIEFKSNQSERKYDDDRPPLVFKLGEIDEQDTEETNFKYTSQFSDQESIRKTGGVPQNEFYQKYKEIEKAGEGGAAFVMKCENIETKEVCAVKYMRNRDVEKQMESQKEFDLIKDISDHQSIIKMKEFITTESFTHTVMEYAPGEELQKIMTDKEGFKKSFIQSVMRQLLSAIVHLHSKLICHKDIKPENIIVDYEHDKQDQVKIKLIDFNISQKCEDSDFFMFTVQGTKLFMSPELIKQKSFNQKIDIWAAGCVLLFMLIGKLPQNGSNMNVKEYEMVSIVNIDDSQNFERSKEFNGLDELEQDLILKMLHPDKNLRLSASDALKHEWLKE